jgi:hypothetical protein
MDIQTFSVEIIWIVWLIVLISVRRNDDNYLHKIGKLLKLAP